MIKSYGVRGPICGVFQFLVNGEELLTVPEKDIEKARHISHTLMIALRDHKDFLQTCIAIDGVLNGS